MSLPAAPSPLAARRPVTIRRATDAEVAATAAIHQRCLPEGFFARLGTGFLARYHDTFRTSAAATLLVAERRGEVVGFLAGTSDNAEHYRRLVRGRPVGLLASGVGALLRDRSLAAEFVRTRTGRYTRALARQLRTRRGPVEPDTSRSARAPRAVAVLTHVAVTDQARGTGAGASLVAAFLDHVATSGTREVRLVTAADGGAAEFYRRLGWRSDGVRDAADGSRVEEFVRTLTP